MATKFAKSAKVVRPKADAAQARQARAGYLISLMQSCEKLTAELHKVRRPADHAQLATQLTNTQGLIAKWLREYVEGQ